MREGALARGPAHAGNQSLRIAVEKTALRLVNRIIETGRLEYLES